MTNETQKMAVQWLVKNLETQDGTYRGFSNIRTTHEKLITQAKEIEKSNMIGLLQWMNKISLETPMRLETDLDDIVDQYYEETYGGN